MLPLLSHTHTTPPKGHLLNSHPLLRGWMGLGNDFGESSYIRDPQRPSQVVPGAEKYVVGHSHDAFRATLPYLIQVYKAAGGGARVVPERDCAVAWYRTTPAACGPDGGKSYMYTCAHVLATFPEFPGGEKGYYCCSTRKEGG